MRLRRRPRTATDRRRNDRRRISAIELADVFAYLEPAAHQYETSEEYAAAHWTWDDMQRGVGVAFRKYDRRGSNATLPPFSALVRRAVEILREVETH